MFRYLRYERHIYFDTIHAIIRVIVLTTHTRVCVCVCDFILNKRATWEDRQVVEWFLRALCVHRGICANLERVDEMRVFFGLNEGCYALVSLDFSRVTAVIILRTLNVSIIMSTCHRSFDFIHNFRGRLPRK